MTPSNPNLSPHTINLIRQFLLRHSSHGNIHHGKAREAALIFGVTNRTVFNVWAAAKLQIEEGKPVYFISNKKGVAKPKRVNLDLDQMKEIAFENRGTIRGLAGQLKVSKSTVGRWIKKGEIKAHTNSIKPELTPENKLQRLNYCLHQIHHDSNVDKLMFDEMYNVVHIDEKWFYMTRVNERYYIVPGEEEPHCACKSKKFITKVMFMCSVSRPILGSEGQVLFDGKIGIFPFSMIEPAKRKSKNRARGTLVTKLFDTVNKKVIRDCIINQIIPAIKAKWPPNMSKDIIMQQDNAKSHILDTDVDFGMAARYDGFNIRLLNQPPNSLDTNINDLGWFRAIQSLQWETTSYNVDDLIKNVRISYNNLTPATLNNVFLSLQAYLIKIMKVEGGNNYKVPHLGKAKMIREGTLSINLEIDAELVMGCILKLLREESNHKLVYDIAELVQCFGV